MSTDQSDLIRSMEESPDIFGDCKKAAIAIIRQHAEPKEGDAFCAQCGKPVKECTDVIMADASARKDEGPTTTGITTSPAPSDEYGYYTTELTPAGRSVRCFNPATPKPSVSSVEEVFSGGGSAPNDTVVKCNRSACRTEGATWWNTSTLEYYCEKCARAINEGAGSNINGVPLCVPPHRMPSPAMPKQPVDLEAAARAIFDKSALKFESCINMAKACAAAWGLPTTESEGV